MYLLNQERSIDMEITCFNCNHIWQVPAGQFLAAKLKFGLGFHEHAFVCPNCHTKNFISKHEVEIADPQIPVTGAHTPMDTDIQHHAHAHHPGGSAPTNPEPTPEASSRQNHGVVLERVLQLHRDHNPFAETMGTLKKGEEITILDTWTDGENPWVQIGPERWALIEDNGDAFIELTDD